MPEKINVVCLTHNRAQTIITHKIVGNLIICCEESQETAYRDSLGSEFQYAIHPDSVKGVCAKRQWIIEHFDNVLMIDDDVVSMQRVCDEDMKMKDPIYNWNMIQMVGNVAGLVGAKLFGFSPHPHPVAYSPMKPFRLTGYVLGGALGMLKGHGLKFNTEFTATDDFYISALNAYRNRICFVDNRFSFAFRDTFKSPGGMASYRTMETEEKDFKLLKKYFGDVIKAKEDAHLSRNKNKFGRTLTIPF